MDQNQNSSEASPQEQALRFLFSDIQYLKGIGPAKARVLKNIGMNNVLDLFFHIPRKYLDRSQITEVSQLVEGTVATVVGEVASSGIKGRKKRRFIVYIQDKTGNLELVWFNAYKYLENFFVPGDILAVTGRVGIYDGFQMSHPDFEIISGANDEPIHTRRIIPIYPETADLKRIGLHSRGLRKIIKPALDHLEQMRCETLPEPLRQEFGLLGLTTAIAQAHFPDSAEAAEEGLRRLAFEELFYLELLLAARQLKRSTQEPGISFPRPKKLGRQLLDNLAKLHGSGFELTAAQIKVLGEIYDDMAKPHPMNRLLQGDVGSGKTIVALLTMLGAVEAGYQAALMAPTEVLADQHGYALSKMLKGVDVDVTVFTGSISARQREITVKKIASGEANIVIGTHTLIQEKLKFGKLGLAVIDEQHRFGVAQRATLSAKGIFPDILIMTATPIPRTLAMTLYGDLDVSIIDEMPPGRGIIKTAFVPMEKRDKMFEFIHSEVKAGRQAYIVYPLVEESDKIDLKAAKESYEKFSKEIFPDLRLGLLHGQMKGDQKNQVMDDFRNRRIDIIVGTTVIEVGLDVANASMMIIEHAERFGLSQLHQLRGRIGRGQHKSYCFLLSDTNLSEEAEKRLQIICASQDGFRIAEADLQIRGPGEMMGTRQHGLPELKVAKLTDSQILGLARKSAFAIISNDGQLLKPENKLLHDVLVKKFSKKIKYSKTA
jgi:ATP-dependent DNA helicase RecG